MCRILDIKNTQVFTGALCYRDIPVAVLPTPQAKLLVGKTLELEHSISAPFETRVVIQPVALLIPGHKGLKGIGYQDD